LGEESKIMGMYTEFVFGACLKRNTPEEVIALLKHMIEGPEDGQNFPLDSDNPIFQHELFKSDRWYWFPRCCSAYFGFSIPSSKIVFECNRWQVSIRCSFKNYDNEVELFIDWIKPFVDYASGNKNFLGYSLYEEADYPVLYFKDSEPLNIRDTE
jgi:hypothetical protein